MSFTGVLKGANRGLVSNHGQEAAHFSFQYSRHISVANHTTFAQELGIRGLS